MARLASENNGKKWELYLNGILIYCWTVKVAQKSVQLLDFYYCEELVGQSGTNWKLLFSSSLAERVMEEEYQGDKIWVSHNIMFAF